MKRDIAMRWVEALRSEKYVQGQNNLLTYECDSDTYETVAKHCALGVLCELAVEDGALKRHDDLSLNEYDVWLLDEGDFLTHVSTSIGAYVDPSVEPESLWDIDVDASHAGYAQVLPEALMLWAEMTYNDGRTSIGPPITVLNDDEGRSFDEIADHIERVWEFM